MDPGGSAAEITRERLHGDAVVDEFATGFGQDAALVATDVSGSGAGARRLGASLVKLGDPFQFGGGGAPACGQARIAGGSSAVGVLKPSAYSLAGAAERIGDLVERLSGVAAPADLVGVCDRVLAPSAVGDLVPCHGESAYVFSTKIEVRGDLVPSFTCAVPLGCHGGDYVPLLRGKPTLSCHRRTVATEMPERARRSIAAWPRVVRQLMGLVMSKPVSVRVARTMPRLAIRA